MLSIGVPPSSRFVANSAVFYLAKRLKHVKKMERKSNGKSSIELALNHFDFHVGEKLGKRWPSVRLGLLSPPKYCAVLNRLNNSYDSCLRELAASGGFNFVDLFKPISEHSGKYNLIKQNDLESEEDDVDNYSEELDGRNQHRVRQSESDLSSSAFADLQSFVPSKRVLSEREKLLKMDIELNEIAENPLSGPREVSTSNESSAWKPPGMLTAVIHGRGDVSRFEPSKRDLDSGKLSYYLMDGGSVLPVLALDLFPGCRVLDLCAAPGGKSYAILQTMLPGSLVCIDKSQSRTLRLKEVIRSYFPLSYLEEEGKVEVLKRDSIEVGQEMPGEFDRVLVDVPCYVDRHSVTEEENNLFKLSRQGERLMIQQQQQALLMSAIRACRPGGIVVYSTCTLSPSQNDGNIRATLEKLEEEDARIEACIVDTGHIAESYEKHFNFNSDPRFSSLGQLVLPNVTANFGPTYFCKLRRIK